MDILANDSRAIQISDDQAERKRRRIQDRSVNVYPMIDGRATECRVYFNDVKGSEAFWA